MGVPVAKTDAVIDAAPAGAENRASRPAAIT
jgi:hypothetical protein